MVSYPFTLLPCCWPQGNHESFSPVVKKTWKCSVQNNSLVCANFLNKTDVCCLDMSNANCLRSQCLTVKGLFLCAIPVAICRFAVIYLCSGIWYTCILINKCMTHTKFWNLRLTFILVIYLVSGIIILLVSCHFLLRQIFTAMLWKRYALIYVGT